MTSEELLATQFEAHRRHLRAVAYRMLGSLAEADDAVQETWIRMSRSDVSEVENLGGWLTTVTARICLNMLRSRKARREDSLEQEVHVPDPIVSNADRVDPEQEALLGDAVGLALQVVLETLSPAERLAFVLHDMFGVSFEEIAVMLDKTPTASRRLASRARRRVRGEAPESTGDPARQRKVVEAFFAASRSGDFDALVAVLHPDIVLRADGGTGRPSATHYIRGAERVASRALMFSRFSPYVQPALINGAPGVVVAPEGRAFSVMAFTIVDDKIAAIDALADPDRLADLDLTVLDP